MNGATIEARRALVASARHHLAKMRDPNITTIGVFVLAELATADLDKVIAIDEKAMRPRPGRRVDGGPG